MHRCDHQSQGWCGQCGGRRRIVPLFSRPKRGGPGVNHGKGPLQVLGSLLPRHHRAAQCVAAADQSCTETTRLSLLIFPGEPAIGIIEQIRYIMEKGKKLADRDWKWDRPFEWRYITESKIQYKRGILSPIQTMCKNIPYLTIQTKYNLTADEPSGNAAEKFSLLNYHLCRM
jgi:hypothetical protein